MRPKIRSHIHIGGQKVPKRVSFYCRHRRQKKQKVSHTPDDINNSSAAKDDRTQEGKRNLRTECPCCFYIILESYAGSLYQWMVYEEDLEAIGRPRKSCFLHRGHPKRIPAIEDKALFSEEQAALILETFLE
jgi:hypothetical protein